MTSTLARATPVEGRLDRVPGLSDPRLQGRERKLRLVAEVGGSRDPLLGFVECSLDLQHAGRRTTAALDHTGAEDVAERSHGREP